MPGTLALAPTTGSTLMSAIFFGSISTLADTSELQRQAFNDAFADAGLPWSWERGDYRAMLGQSGGRDRVAQFAEARGEDVDADAVHRAKSEHFRAALAASPPPPRPGVAGLLADAQAAGITLALVTTTSPENVAALLDAMGPDVSAGAFDLVVDANQVAEPKPDAASYLFALGKLGVPASDCVAVEDNPDGARAAISAGVSCVAFPNENTAGLEFPPTSRRVESLRLDELRGIADEG